MWLKTPQWMNATNCEGDQKVRPEKKGNLQRRRRKQEKKTTFNVLCVSHVLLYVSALDAITRISADETLKKKKYNNKKQIFRYPILKHQNLDH